MTIPVRIGFIPLVDAALLVAARQQGFAEAEGLSLDLVREAPAAIASTLGIGHVKVPLAIPAALNLNGNAITVSRSLYEALAAAADGDIANPGASARALKRLIEARKAKGEPPLTFAMTFPFSMHNYQLQIWMRWGGVDPNEDLRLVVIPPPLMAKSLESRHIDGFCVGAPWNAMTVAGRRAAILHLGSQIVAHCPEKVLAVRAERMEGAVIAPLVRAIVTAAEWCSDSANRPLLARHLAHEDILGVPAGVIERVLEGRLPLGSNGLESDAPDYLRLDPSTTRPDPAHADFLIEQMVLAGQIADAEDHLKPARAMYRTSTFDMALGVRRVHEAPRPLPWRRPDAAA